MEGVEGEERVKEKEQIRQRWSKKRRGEKGKKGKGMRRGLKDKAAVYGPLVRNSGSAPELNSIKTTQYPTVHRLVQLSLQRNSGYFSADIRPARGLLRGAEFRSDRNFG